MKRVAFKMTLLKGFEEEYKKRHDAIWPELVELLQKTGISDYSIFLDETTGALYGSLKVEDESSLSGLAEHDVMKKWWVFMKDIMETNADSSPASIALKEVFYLP